MATAAATTNYLYHMQHLDASYAVYDANNKMYAAQQKLYKVKAAAIEAEKAVAAATKELETATLAHNTSKKAYEDVHAEYRANVCRNIDIFNATNMKITDEEYQAIIKPIKDELIAQAQKLIQLYKDKATHDDMNNEENAFKAMLKGKSKYIDNRILYYAHNGIDTMNEHQLETFIKRISY